jgi:mannose-6-phosphate isomerase-like protein (cupin superfamily)
MPGYFVVETPQPQPQDIHSDVIRRSAWIDDNVCKGAPYFETVWILKDIPKGPGVHHHDFDEFLGFMGGDINNPMELGCDVELYVKDEVLKISRNCLIFLPAGTKHGILSVKNVTTPVLNYSGGPNVAYSAVEDGRP